MVPVILVDDKLCEEQVLKYPGLGHVEYLFRERIILTVVGVVLVIHSFAVLR